MQLDIHHLRGFAACGVNAKKGSDKGQKRAQEINPNGQKQKKKIIRLLELAEKRIVF